MAAIVYFKKVSDEPEVVRYMFGEDPEGMNRQLVMVKHDRKSEPEDGNINYTFLKASRKINSMFDESARWPERGMSVS